MAELATVTLLLLALAAGGFAAHRFRLPPALGYLGVGVALGALAPDAVPHSLHEVAEIGILVLLFLIGIELDLKRLREALGRTAWTMPFDIAVPALLAAGAARLLGWSGTEATALGIVVAVSSTLFGERLVAQPGVHGSARQRVLGVLISEDVAAGGLIAVLVVLASGAPDIATPVLALLKTGLLLLLLAGAAILLIPRLLDEVARRHMPELLVLWAAGLVALFGYLGTMAGSSELGALLAGVAAAEAGSRYVTRNALIGLRDIAAALFFFASGASVDPGLIAQHLPLAALIAGVVLVSKHLVHVPSAIAGRVSLPGALQTGAALATLGEFNLILVAVAEREELAHPALRAVVVGAMLLLLPTATLLGRTAPWVAGRFWALSPKKREPWLVLAQAIRRRPSTSTAKQWGVPARKLLANSALLAAWTAVAAWALPRLPTFAGPGWVSGALWAGLAFAVALPLLRSAYRNYRDLVWILVGLRPGERVGAGKVRARLVDAWVALSAVLVLAAISLWLPRALPVLLGAAVVATIVAAFAWRRLNRFHRALETALGRILGDDEAGTRFLDQVLDQYPWGVRFAAVSVPANSPVARHTLRDSRIGHLTGATVAVVQRGKQETVNPEPEHMILPGDQLVLLGDSNQLARAEAIIVAHGDVVRMSAQSLTACVEEIEVLEASPWAGKQAADLRIREATGTLIVGRWRPSASHPQPFRGDMVIEAGDRLILLGTPLQLQRAKVLAGAIPVAES